MRSYTHYRWLIVLERQRWITVYPWLPLVAPQQQFIKWVIIGNLKLYESYLEVLYPFIQCILGASGGLEGTPSFVALGRVIIYDLNFKRTENHNFTITTNTSQHVEFFHSLIFLLFRHRSKGP